MLVLAIAVRAPFLTHPGYAPDLNLHKVWGVTLAERGFEALRDLPNSPVTYFPNYAIPLFLFKGVAAFYKTTYGASGIRYDDPAFTALVKLPGLLADLSVGLLLFLWARMRTSDVRSLLAPALYLFSPGVIYDTAVWGQIDSVHTALALGAFFAWSADRRTLAGALLVAAMMTKLQAIVFLPLLLLLMIRADGVRGFLAKRLPAMAVTAFFITLPYALSVGLGALLLGSLGSVAKYPFLTLNAMNIWWPVTRIAGGLVRDDQGVTPLVYVGFALFLLAVLEILHRMRRQHDDLAILKAGALLALAFFLFPTEIHERYLFPFFAFAAIPAAEDRRWRFAYLLLSAGFLVNMIIAAPVVPAGWLKYSLGGIMPLVDFWWVVNIAVFLFLLRSYHSVIPAKAGIHDVGPNRGSPSSRG